MESTRQEKIARMLQKEFGEIFIHYARQIQGTLISVSEVRITPDLSIARIYLSVFPTDKATAEALLPKVSSMLDKLAKRNIIHRNKAANLKSSLALHTNAL